MERELTDDGMSMDSEIVADHLFVEAESTDKGMSIKAEMVDED